MFNQEIRKVLSIACVGAAIGLISCFSLDYSGFSFQTVHIYAGAIILSVLISALITVGIAYGFKPCVVWLVQSVKGILAMGVGAAMFGKLFSGCLMTVCLLLACSVLILPVCSVIGIGRSIHALKSAREFDRFHSRL